MKFLKRFNLFEREMSKQWVDKNQDFYLMQNKEHLKNKAEIKSKVDDLTNSLNVDSIKVETFDESDTTFSIVFPDDFLNKISEITGEDFEDLTFNINLYKRKDRSLPNLSYYDNKNLGLNEKILVKAIQAFMKAFPGSYIYDENISALSKAGITSYKIDGDYGKDTVITNLTSSQNNDNGDSILLQIRSILRGISPNDLQARLNDKTEYSERWTVSVKPDVLKENKNLLGLLNQYYDITDNKIVLGMDFQIEYPLNRIHTSMFGLSSKLKGIGLGYKMYKALINELGYARSSFYSTNENSRKIWYHLIQDKDYYSIILNKGVKEISDKSYLTDRTAKIPEASKVLEGVMIISKNYPLEQIEELVDKCKESFDTIEMDDKLNSILNTNESYDYDDDGEEEEDELFYQDLEDSKNRWGVIRVYNEHIGNWGYIIEPHKFKYKRAFHMMDGAKAFFTMVRQDFLEVAKNADHAHIEHYLKEKSRYRIKVNLLEDKICRKFPDDESIAKVKQFLSDNGVPENKFRFERTPNAGRLREGFEFEDDEDEEEENVYSETNGYIENMKRSKDEWGTFNLLVGKYNNPMTCIIDDTSVCTFVRKDKYLNVSFINIRLFDDYGTMVYDSSNEFFDTVDSDYTLIFRIYKDAETSASMRGAYTNLKFASDDDKNRFANFVKQMEDIQTEYDIQASVRDYLKN